MLPFASLTSSRQLTPDIISGLFVAIDNMATIVAEQGTSTLLQDKVVALLFFEPSSRTMLSFQSAAQRLKAGTIFAQSASTTSFEKGESLEDLIQIVNGYADIIVMRHSQPGSAEVAAQVSDAPFINAGDGGNEHPTQSIIDSYTIHKHRGRLDNLNVVFGFDSLQSRSIHSLSRLLAQYEGNRFTFTGPQELWPSSELLSELRAAGAQCDCVSEVDYRDNFDVVYVNRLQEERFADTTLFEANRRKYRITRDNIEGCDALLLDPLPRIDEIATEVDALENAVYFKQASYGVPVRMALLALLLGKINL
ncbi:MAG: aspartate carbamoyltransferase [Gammaproteobacteria bacterium]|nr:aspartate carbamoyltransferase [Gammaproteobacteria bacterium]